MLRTAAISMKASKLLSGDGTGAIASSGNLVNGTTTDLVAAYNAASAKNLPASLATTTGAGVLS